MNKWTGSYNSFENLQKKLINSCENVEPKTWPYTKSKSGAFLIPFMEEPAHIGIISKTEVNVASSIYLPGGFSSTDSPRSTMLEQASLEMGIEEEDIQILGYLGLHPLQNIEFDAHIFLGWTPPMEEWELDSDQIEQAFKIPLEYFIEEFRSPQFDLKRPDFTFQTGDEEESSLNDSMARIISMLIHRIVTPVRY